MRTQVNLSVGHMQVDNLVSNEYPVILGPKKLNLDLITNDKNYKELSPLQFMYRMVEHPEKLAERRAKKKPEELDQEEKEGQLPFLCFSFQKKETKYAQALGVLVRYDTVHFAMQEFLLQVNSEIIMENVKMVLATQNLLLSESELLVSNPANAHLIEKQNWERPMEEICAEVSPYLKIDEGSMNVRKISFGVIMIGSMKMTINTNLS